jgi:hypothetical protein
MSSVAVQVARKRKESSEKASKEGKKLYEKSKKRAKRRHSTGGRDNSSKHARMSM